MMQRVMNFVVVDFMILLLNVAKIEINAKKLLIGVSQQKKSANPIARIYDLRICDQKNKKNFKKKFQK